MSDQSKTIECPKCHRQIAVIGKGKNIKLAKHNGKYTFAILRRRHASNAVSDMVCEGSGDNALDIMISRAEQEHAAAKRAELRAVEELTKAQDKVDASRASAKSTAAEVVRLHEIRDSK